MNLRRAAGHAANGPGPAPAPSRPQRAGPHAVRHTTKVGSHGGPMGSWPPWAHAGRRDPGPRGLTRADGILAPVGSRGPTGSWAPWAHMVRRRDPGSVVLLGSRLPTSRPPRLGRPSGLSLRDGFASPDPASAHQEYGGCADDGGNQAAVGWAVLVPWPGDHGNEHERRPMNDTATRIYCTSLRQGFR